MLNILKPVVGVVAGLVVGAAGCSSPSQTETDAQAPAASDESAEVAELLVDANAGNARAQFLLGYAYLNGDAGVPQDDAQAVLWFRKAAEQGDASAQFSLGVMHRDGQFFPRDRVTAAPWFRKAADQGHVWAQRMLVNIYAQEVNYTPTDRARVFPKDVVEAYKWASVAKACQAQIGFSIPGPYDTG